MRPQIVKRDREGRRPGWVVRPVKQDVAAVQGEQLQPTRPDSGRIPGPPSRSIHARDARELQRVEGGVRDGHVGRLVSAAQADPGAPEPRQLHLDPIAVPTEEWGGLHFPQRHAQPPRASTNDRQPLTARAGHGEVPPLDDRGLLARDLRDCVAEPIHVIEVDVGDHGHAAVPGMGRVQAASQADFHESDVRSDLGESGEEDGGQQFEFGRVTVTRSDAVSDDRDASDQPGEVRAGDRLPIDLDPLAIGRQMRLGRCADTIAGRPKGRVRESQHAALAIRSGDERAADRPLGMVQLAKQRTCPAETQPDTEPAAPVEGAQGLLIGQRCPRHADRRPVTRGSVLPRRRCTD